MHHIPPVLLAAAMIAAAATPANAAPRPNIVLIMCDDMGFSDIGCYGGEIRTPNLDRLAAEGLRFKQFYNCAKCITTRFSLLTGLHPRRPTRLTDGMVTIAEILRDAGYRTALSGKWHLGANKPHRPIDRGFDEFFGLLDGCCNFFDPSIADPKFKGSRVRVVADNHGRITEFPDDFYMTDAITDHAVKQIRNVAAGGKPLFLHVCYTAPHYPLHAKPEDIARYKSKYLLGWEVLRRERHARQVKMGLIDAKWTLPGLDPKAKPWSSVGEHRAWQDMRMAVYAAMIDSMDQGIGRIMAALQQAGIDDNTLVLFLSDNGGCSERYGQDIPSVTPGTKDTYTTCGPSWAWAQNTPFRRYKTWVHEGGTSTPLIARWPGVIEPDTMTDQVGHVIDFLPTCAELAGAKLPAVRNGKPLLPVEGLSLLPVLQGKTRKGHETLYWHWAGNGAVREGDWKVVWDKTVRRWELYDLAADRTETNDLASAHPDKVAAMTAKYDIWAKTVGFGPKPKKKPARNRK